MKPETVLLQAEIIRAIAEDPLASRRSEEENQKALESTRQAVERADRLHAERETSVAARFEQFLEKLRQEFGRTTPMNEDQEKEFTWVHRVAPKLKTLGLEDKHIHIIDDWHCQAQERVFNRVKSLCTQRGAVVALVGNRGTGKTTIAAQLMRERAQAESAWYHAEPEDREAMTTPLEAGRYAKLSQLGQEFKALFADFGSINAPVLVERFDAWARLPLLVIDEIHEAEDLKTHTRILTDLVDRRYARKVDTILISNHDAATFKAQMNQSILSRISEHGTILECRWESWRKPQKA